MTLKQSNQRIGYCGLAIETIDHKLETELGYRFSQSFWGKGLATEAVKSVLNYRLYQLKLQHIVAVVEPENLALVQVIEKLGMNYEKQTLF